MSNFFKNKKFVFTGKLESMQRSEAQEKVVEQGGISGKNLTEDTDFLIVGGYTQDQLDGRIATNKLTKAYEILNKGLPLRIFSESVFLDCFGDTHDKIESFNFEKAIEQMNERQKEIYEIAQKLPPNLPFSSWPEEIHSFPGQEVRHRNPIYNPKYETAFTSCSCSDFLERHLPCQHIYELAIRERVFQIATTN